MLYVIYNLITYYTDARLLFATCVINRKYKLLNNQIFTKSNTTVATSGAEIGTTYTPRALGLPACELLTLSER
jgi:hypothetical protein